MKKVPFLVLACVLTLFLAQPAEAGPTPRPISRELIETLLVLFKTPIILVPVVMGLIFDRRSIIRWHFLSIIILIFIFPFVLTLIAQILNPGRGDGLLLGTYSVMLLLVVLYFASLFTVIAFLASVAGSKWGRIREVQNIFNRFDAKYKIVINAGVYFLAAIPILSFAYVGRRFKPVEEIAVGILSLSILYWTFIKAKKLPPQEILFVKSDYLFFGLVLFFLVVATLLTFKIAILTDSIVPY